ncbi:hypothetical protein OA074_00695 [bacterium]|nr:hypothetical protein [bacterium]
MFNILLISVIVFVICYLFFKLEAVREFLRGDRTLAESYWVWAIFGPAIVIFSLSLFLEFLIKNDVSLNFGATTYSVIIGVPLNIFFIYYNFALLGAIRSANKYIEEYKKKQLNPFWGRAAQIMLFISGAYIPLIIVFIKNKILEIINYYKK